MKDETLSKVQELIESAEAQKKVLVESTKDRVDQIAKDAARLATLEMVEGIGELLKDLDKEAQESWHGFDDAIVSFLAKKYIAGAEKRV